MRSLQPGFGNRRISSTQGPVLLTTCIELTGTCAAFAAGRCEGLWNCAQHGEVSDATSWQANSGRLELSATLSIGHCCLIRLQLTDLSNFRSLNRKNL